MKLQVGVLFTVGLLLISVPQSEAQSLRQTRICIDNTKNKLTLRRRCKAPRFTEVTPDFLTNSDDNTLSSPEVVTEVTELDSTFSGDITGNTARCPEGKIVTGGGISLVDNDKFSVRASQPRSDLSGWTGRVTAEKNSATAEMTVWAVCATGTAVESDE